HLRPVLPLLHPCPTRRSADLSRGGPGRSTGSRGGGSRPAAVRRGGGPRSWRGSGSPSGSGCPAVWPVGWPCAILNLSGGGAPPPDRKSTRLNCSHVKSAYGVV